MIIATSHRLAAPLLALASAATLTGAYGFQYLGGLDPCVLCWYQRYPHALVVLLGLAGWWLGTQDARLAVAALALAALALAIGAGIAGFHVGVEQHWWAGTASCGSTAAPDTLDALRAQLLAQPIVRCDEVAWSLFGLSMAGYNGLISAGLAAFAGWAAWTRATEVRQS